MEEEKEVIRTGEVFPDEITIGELKARHLEAGHIALGMINLETGKTGVKHLYSDAYRERWPQDEYPEAYEEDVPVD